MDEMSDLRAQIEAVAAQMVDFVPNLLTAAGYLLLALVVAWAASWLSRTTVDATPIGRRANEDAAKARRPVLTLGHSVGAAVFWLVFLLFLPSILRPLGFDETLQPLEATFQAIGDYLPNILGALLIILFGWLIASVARRAVTGILAAAPIDRGAERAGLGGIVNGLAVARAAGVAAFALIFILATIAGLEALEISTVSQPLAEFLRDVLDAIPRLIAATLILLVAYLIGRGVKSILLALLASVRFDRIWSALETDARKAADEALPEAAPDEPDYSDDPESAIAEYSGAAEAPSPSRIVADIAMVAIVIFGAVQAAEILNFAIISAWLARVLEIGGNILFGAVIIVVGLFIARFVAVLVSEGDGARADIAASVARYGVSMLAIVIGLSQMELGGEIVRWGFLIVLGGVSLAFGIAFGVGGRDEAARLLKRLDDRSGGE